MTITQHMNNQIIVTPLFYGLACHYYTASGFWVLKKGHIVIAMATLADIKTKTCWVLDTQEGAYCYRNGNPCGH